MTSVAFLGLGAIGTPMAGHLAAGAFDLVVWNRTAAKADAFAKAHEVRVARSPAEAARGCEVVIACLPSSREVESIVDGDDGLLAGLEPGSVFVDCTSGDPATSRRIAAQLSARDVRFLDAPVSGGVGGAVKGALTVMVGGALSVLEEVRPVLASFAAKIVHCGPVGAGDAVKAVNNALLAVHILTTAEGLATLAKAGVDAAVALDVINGSSGRSNTSQNLFPERVIGRAFPRTFRLALLDKDIGIAADVAREHGVPTPVIQLAAELMRVAHRELGDEADHVEAVKMIERWAGVEIGA